VRDDSERLIATSELEVDPTIAQPQRTGLTVSETVRAISGICRYVFTANVPDSPFYSVEVAGRKGPVYNRTDLERDGWNVTLDLGG
jgi:hypothetical protein